MIPGWTEKFSGVHSRPWIEDETLTSLAAGAARQALALAGLTIEQVDLVLVAGACFEQPLPCNAAFLLRALGAEGVAGFDINATCLSFLSGFETALWYLQSGRYQRILLVNTEIASLHLNTEHRESFSLFGDGATAYLLGRHDDPLARFRLEWLGGRHETYPSEIEACGIRGGGGVLSVFDYSAENDHHFRFFMDGPRLFQKSDELVLGFLGRLLGPLGVGLQDIDWVVPHQASGMAMRLMRRRMGIDKARWVDILKDHGNQVSVSIPMALQHLLGQGVAVGQTILICGTGAGLGLGGQLLRVDAVL